MSTWIVGVMVSMGLSFLAKEFRNRSGIFWFLGSFVFYIAVVNFNEYAVGPVEIDRFQLYAADIEKEISSWRLAIAITSGIATLLLGSLLVFGSRKLPPRDLHLDSSEEVKGGNHRPV